MPLSLCFWGATNSRPWKTIDYNVLARKYSRHLFRTQLLWFCPTNLTLIKFLYGIILPVVPTPYCLHPLTWPACSSTDGARIDCCCYSSFLWSPGQLLSCYSIQLLCCGGDSGSNHKNNNPNFPFSRPDARRQTLSECRSTDLLLS